MLGRVLQTENVRRAAVNKAVIAVTKCYQDAVYYYRLKMRFGLFALFHRPISLQLAVLGSDALLSYRQREDRLIDEPK